MRYDLFRSRRAVVLAVSLLSATALSACTVRPLYSDAPIGTETSATVRSELAAIAIKPVQTRYGQEVRNQLIFLLGGGGGEPASPLYSLDLTVTALRESAAVRQVALNENEPTAATVTLSGRYVLTRIADGEVVGTGTQKIMSSFDVPRQAYAEIRAETDAQNRAARELAELLRLAIAQDVARR